MANFGLGLRIPLCNLVTIRLDSAVLGMEGCEGVDDGGKIGHGISESNTGGDSDEDTDGESSGAVKGGELGTRFAEDSTIVVGTGGSNSRDGETEGGHRRVGE